MKNDVKKYQEEILKLLKSYPESFINRSGEFIPSNNSNCYFRLFSDEIERFTRDELALAVLMHLSRGFKERPWKINKKNEEHQRKMNNGLNEFLGTSFSAKDIEDIYIYSNNKEKMQKVLENKSVECLIKGV